MCCKNTRSTLVSSRKPSAGSRDRTSTGRFRVTRAAGTPRRSTLRFRLSSPRAAEHVARFVARRSVRRPARYAYVSGLGFHGTVLYRSEVTHACVSLRLSSLYLRAVEATCSRPETPRGASPRTLQEPRSLSASRGGAKQPSLRQEVPSSRIRRPQDGRVGP